MMISPQLSVVVIATIILAAVLPVAKAICERIPRQASPEVCMELYNAAGLLTPFECQEETDFACCTEANETAFESLGLFNCTQAGEPLEMTKPANCIGTGALARKTRSANNNNQTAAEICNATFGSTFAAPYECTSGLKFACCEEGQGNEIFPGTVLGTCWPLADSGGAAYGGRTLATMGLATVFAIAGLIF